VGGFPQFSAKKVKGEEKMEGKKKRRKVEKKKNRTGRHVVPGGRRKI
jgi:hypothetical protein